MIKSHLLAGSIGFAACACLGAVLAFGPDHDGHDHHHHDAHHDNHAAPSNTAEEMSPEEMMAAYMALGNPGEHHEELKMAVGEWEANTSFIMDPANPDQKEDGVGSCSVKMIMDGRFSKTKFDSDFMGIPFTGYAYSGYDNARKQHVSIWMDTMSTAIMYMTGNKNEDGDLVMQGTTFAPGVGDYEMRMVYHWDDENNWSQNFYDQLPDGSWMHTGVITYTRK
jgi:hypothetical protein